MKYFIIITFILAAGLNLRSQDGMTEAEALNPNSYTKSVYPEGNYDNVVFVNGNLSLNSFPQNEPSVRISRVNPNIVVAAWRDFKLGYIDPDIVRRIGYTYSTNGGLSWAAPQLLPDPNPDHTSQSDPVITSDAQGNFYISSTSRKPVSGFNRDMLLYKSTNNGQTFVLYSTAVPGTGGSGEDKEWIFCDPVTTNTTFNNIFISWTSFGPAPGIKFRKSTNGGLNWSTTVNVGDNTQGQGSNNCTGTNNQIYIVWAANGIRFDRSTNGGTSFGTDFQLSNISSTNGFPFICVDYSNNATRGNVYVLWDDMRNGNSDVWFQRSTNGGANWLAAPVRVNDVTTNDQFWPMMQCDNNGNLFAVYYDTRTGASSVNSYIAYSTDAGSTWINQLMSDSSFTMQQPNSDVRYGDYISIDAYNGKVVPVWTDQRKGFDDQEIYTANLDNLISVSVINSEVPASYMLYQNYPNPFNPVTKINFDVQKSSFVNLRVFDILGREVRLLVNQNLSPGKYSVNFDASMLPSGAYFYKIEAGEYTNTKKMLLIK
ncbi:MAG: T9SS type A sorting domain-containing protein [Ignavibacteria bacterium]